MSVINKILLSKIENRSIFYSIPTNMINYKFICGFTLELKTHIKQYFV